MPAFRYQLVCENYFEDNCPEIRIALDPLKTPQQNAAARYKDFSRKKAAKEHLTVLIAQGEEQCDYLSAVLDEIERAETERDLSDIRRELAATGYVKKSSSKKPDRNKPNAATVRMYVRDRSSAGSTKLNKQRFFSNRSALQAGFFMSKRKC